MDPEQIIEIIKNLPLKEALSYLTVQKIFDLGKEGYEAIRRIIREKCDERKYGFVPEKEEANFLVRVAEKEYFKEFGYILPNNPYSDLIRVGYLIAYLNKIGGEENRQRVEKIRVAVFQQPNGAVLMKIVNLVTTGAIVSIIDYLGELKRRNYDLQYINYAFEEIIIDWEKYTYFVKAGTDIQEIISNIKNKMQNRQKLIMIFSYGSAKEPVTKAVAELRNEEEFSGIYFYESKNNLEGEKEVHSSTFTLMESSNGVHN